MLSSTDTIRMLHKTNNLQYYFFQKFMVVDTLLNSLLFTFLTSTGIPRVTQQILCITKTHVGHISYSPKEYFHTDKNI